MLVTLRAGNDATPLFLFPGAGGRASEMAALAKELSFSGTLTAVEFLAPWNGKSEALRVEDIAQHCARELGHNLPAGNFRLLGYSFGGLIAVETAAILKADGREVDPVILIDSFYSDRYWPRHLFLAAMARRTAVHLSGLKKLSARAALREFGFRASRLLQRIRRRAGATGYANEMGGDFDAQRSIAAMQHYKPRFYPGRLILLKAGNGSDLAVDSEALWKPLAGKIVSLGVPGDHRSVLRDAESVHCAAKLVDDVLGNTGAQGRLVRPAPVVLIVTAFRWFSTARLAMSVSEAGFRVQVVCPAGNPVERMAAVERTYPYRALHPASSLKAALDEATPDLLVPCDDVVGPELHALCTEMPANAAFQELVRKSMGNPACLASYYSRYDISTIARDMQVAVPRVLALAGPDGLGSALEKLGTPAVMKSDYSWGGTGVITVATAGEAVRAYHRLSSPPSLARAVKHSLVNRNNATLLAWQRGLRRPVSLHEFVHGRPGNAAVACYKGKLLGAVCTEVIQSDGPTGPATVIEIVDHPEMLRTVEIMVERLELSGLVGFDFILGKDDRKATMIELNPRATPTCHLISAQGVDLCEALYGALTGTGPLPVRAPLKGPVALFPQEINRDPDSKYLVTGHHDFPTKLAALAGHIRKSH